MKKLRYWFWQQPLPFAWDLYKMMQKGNGGAVFPKSGRRIEWHAPKDKMIDEILQRTGGYHKCDNPDCVEKRPLKEALTAIYEIGLEVIGGAEPNDYIDNGEPAYHRETKARNELRASQRKAWAKACGVAEK